MTLDIIINDELLSRNFSIANIACKPLIENYKIELKSNSSYLKLENAISESIILYTGSYKAIKEFLRGSNVITSIKQKDIFANAIASKGAAIYFGIKTGAIGTGKNKRDDDFIDYNSEEKAITSSFQILNNTIKDTSKFTSLIEAIKSGYDALATCTSNEAFITNNYLANNIKVESNYFAFQGLQTIDVIPKTKIKEQVKENGDEKIIKDPVHITITKPISKEQIQGNKEAIQVIENSIDKLMAYDVNSRENPESEEGFIQQILLYGDSGTGKSMVAEYAITKAQEIAKKYNLPFEAVKLQINTSWQDGHVQILRHQLNYITQPDKMRFVLLEEVERIFPSRTETNNETTTKIIDEFIDLTNQTAYPNYNNYVITMITNMSLKVDRAIRRRAREGTYECKGPETKEEKIIVLKNNLAKRIDQGYIQIKNWNDIGNMAMELELGGSDLRDVSNLVKKYISSSKRPENYYGLNLLEKKAVIKNNRRSIYDTEFKKIMYQIASTEEKLRSADNVFRSG